jgi:MFS family permease
MRSLRSRLLALWVMLALSGSATAYLLFESFQQTAQARVARSEERAARACRDIFDRFRLVVTTWSGPEFDDDRKGELARAVQTALASANGIEGGIWQDGAGSLAYAFPTYEGTGPKTDVPVAESATIGEVNAQAPRTGEPASTRQSGRSQVLLVEACPLLGPLPGLPVRGALYTLSDNPAWLVGVQLLDGVGAGIFGAIFPVIVADLMRETGRFNVAQGAVITAQGTGAALSTSLAGVVVVKVGYSAAFLTLGAIAAIGVLACLVLLPGTAAAATTSKRLMGAPLPPDLPEMKNADRAA